MVLRPFILCFPVVSGLLIGALIAGPQSSPAHDLFTAYIQHRVMIAVGAKHIDVTVQLTFFEDGSEHERKHIDGDGDCRLSRAEIDAYLKTLESRLSAAVSLKAGGVPVRLTPLREPELDLMEHDRVGRDHLRLTLFLFGPTPSKLPPGTDLVVEDRLWPEARALGSIQAEGKDACRLEALPASDPLFPPAKDNEARCFRVRVLSPPRP